ncbi:chemotaxis protein CheW [Poseidonibacter lekithochrous]|uniref:chemotaxis protein CheW n=1 Tax=Poseidonibacter lekithochrous TaxID=1904463 RepID=UPI0008FC21A9|nr:chemotaxis protein CheW [Poseidonibacter lekithochrous]QKJ22674.1 purine-binding chemotaxis protein CheW [Poseidonibacter lekithochrous]
MYDEQEEELINNTGEQYFLFLSNNDLYALPVLIVREIVEYQDITKVPKLNSYVKGVTNIRGNIVAVIDLLDRFEVQETQVLDRTSFAIVQVNQNSKVHDIAIMIDEIYEVDGLDENSLCDTPLFGTKIDTKFIKNIAKYNDKEVCIINHEEVLKISELSAIKD